MKITGEFTFRYKYPEMIANIVKDKSKQELIDFAQNRFADVVKKYLGEDIEFINANNIIEKKE